MCMHKEGKEGKHSCPLSPKHSLAHCANGACSTDGDRGKKCDFCSLQVSFHLPVTLQREHTKENMKQVRIGRRNKVSVCFSCYFRGNCC